MKKFFALLSICFVLITPVLAQYGLDETAGAANLTGGPTNPTEIVGKAIGAGLSLVGIVFFILTLYAGIVWMVSRGNEEQAKNALNTIIAAAIGLIITMSAYAITSFILDAANQSALGSGGNGPQNVTLCDNVTDGICLSECISGASTENTSAVCSDNTKKCCVLNP